MLTFRFDFEKALHAASVVADAHGGRLDRMRLLKILYIADREMLFESGRLITGDTPHALKFGPVPSKIYDLIKGSSLQSTRWNEYLHNEGYQVVQRKPCPNTGSLSAADVAKLVSVCNRYHGTDTIELSELTHLFPEWIRAFRPSEPQRAFAIDWSVALSEVGRQDMVESIGQDETYMNSVDELFESAA